MFTTLRDALQALAAPSDVQLARFPLFVAKADELAIDFHESLLLVTQDSNSQLSTEQAVALRDLDALLDAMSGVANAELWTEHALRHSAAWQEVRRAAMRALIVFAWPAEPPPPTRNVYVR